MLRLTLQIDNEEIIELCLSNEEDERRKGIVCSQILTKMRTNAKKPRSLDQGWLIDLGPKWMQVKKISGLFSATRQKKQKSIGKKSEISQAGISETLKMMPGLLFLKHPSSPNSLKN